ncbi:MAG: hypothetical protein ACREF5_01410 [Candidatus Saccharimonadales bacterium]
MFGHDNDDNTAQNDNQGMPMEEPVEDGTLGKPDAGSGSSDLAASSDSEHTAHDSPSLLPIEPPHSMTPGPSLPEPTTPAHSGTDDLLSIKQNALQQLKPLVGHLDQTPQERFQTTMMMIQAADDQSLIGEAYKAAESISDDKDRAQALLDVINEINYFSSKKEN